MGGVYSTPVRDRSGPMNPMSQAPAVTHVNISGTVGCPMGKTSTPIRVPNVRAMSRRMIPVEAGFSSPVRASVEYMIECTPTRILPAWTRSAMRGSGPCCASLRLANATVSVTASSSVFMAPNLRSGDGRGARGAAAKQVHAIRFAAFTPGDGVARLARAAMSRHGTSRRCRAWADTSVFEPSVQLRERHHHVFAIGGTFGKRAVPALDVRHARARDVDAEVAVEVGPRGDIGEGEAVAQQKRAVGEDRIQ